MASSLVSRFVTAVSHSVAALGVVACGGVNEIGEPMVVVPGGTFMMGPTTPSAETGRLHQVTVRSFAIDVSEVTVRSYRDCVKEERCRPPSLGIVFPTICNYQLPDHDDFPINCVRAEHARDYCAWQGKRLPTEEEWEYAARYPDNRAYPWGNEPPDVTRLNYADDTYLNMQTAWGADGYIATAPVHSFPAGDSALGIQDLAGNVWEWTDSPFCEYPTTPCNSCPLTETCDESCVTCEDRLLFVMRGAGYNVAAPPLDANDYFYYRARNTPEYYFDYVGFRCARSIH